MAMSNPSEKKSIFLNLRFPLVRAWFLLLWKRPRPVFQPLTVIFVVYGIRVNPLFAIYVRFKGTSRPTALTRTSVVNAVCLNILLDDAQIRLLHGVRFLWTSLLPPSDDFPPLRPPGHEAPTVVVVDPAPNSSGVDPSPTHNHLIDDDNETLAESAERGDSSIVNDTNACESSVNNDNGLSIDNSEMPTGNGAQSNDSNNLSTANSGQCAESNEIVNCNVTDVNSQSIDNCSEMSTGNGGQSNSSNNLSTANSEQCAVSSESVNRSIELGGRSIVNNSEMTTENSGLLIDNNGKSTGINERTVDGSTENSGKLISGNESGPTLN